MSQLLLASPSRTSPAGTSFAEQQPDRPVVTGRGLTLDERISRVWEGILATGTADCPVCRGHMERMGETARCLRCNSSLS
jgi:hypothetical protein